MKFKDSDSTDWNSVLAAQKGEPYGVCCFKFAEAWADKMESAIVAGETLAQCAERCSHEVGRLPGMGITGFMYGMAVAILARCWEHGEELRCWHNLNTQLGNEGEKANESGGVLNPALLSVESRNPPQEN